MSQRNIYNTKGTITKRNNLLYRNNHTNYHTLTLNSFFMHKINAYWSIRSGNSPGTLEFANIQYLEQICLKL